MRRTESLKDLRTVSLPYGQKMIMPIDKTITSSDKTIMPREKMITSIDEAIMPIDKMISFTTAT